MDDYDDLLKSAIETVAGGFKAAYQDLQGIVTALNKSLKSQVGDKFEIGIEEVQQNIKGALYRVTLDPDVEDFQSTIVSVAFLRFQSKGYPLVVGTYSRVDETFSPREALEDRAALEKFFKTLLQNPDSTLVQALGYALRKSGGT